MSISVIWKSCRKLAN